jgi:deoxyribodipyrimidine photolyase-related protein
MKKVSLLFPNQLFKESEILKRGFPIYLLEYGLYFTKYSFHKAKLAFHRASMSYYLDYCRERSLTIHRIESGDPLAKLSTWFVEMRSKGVEKVCFLDPSDDWLEKRIRRYAGEQGIQLEMFENPNFICERSYLEDYFARSKYFLTDFYIAQRKRFDILMEGGKPKGGKWTYDTDNRKKLPKDMIIPGLPTFFNAYWAEAKQYVLEHFSKNIGSLDSFVYPLTHAEAELALERFLEERFLWYGSYQDAIVPEQNFLFHSLISPALNTGLLDPLSVLQRALDFAEEKQLPLNTLEGFVRQILGWREYIRAVYHLKGGEERTRNFWSFEREIPSSFYRGETGILPVDHAIKRVLATGYNHHIERLMVLGNFMLLCEFQPDAVYRWFMEMYIDAYDWVMVPNVYGMSQYSDGGLMSTKPYISGSNYIFKMSHYERSGTWPAIWDALYWRFIDRHKDFFASNFRMSMMVRQWDKMPEEKRKSHLSLAATYLSKLQ